MYIYFSLAYKNPASFQFDCSFVEGYHLNFLCYKMCKQIDKQTGKKKTIITLSELETIVNDPCFDDEENDFEGRIDIVELPSATVDVVSDEEEIDEEDLGKQSPKDITGCIEIYDTVTGTDSAVSTDPRNTEKEPPAKKTRRKVEFSWQKTRPDFHIKRGSKSHIDEMVRKRERKRERERERSVYLNQTFSINYRLKHTKKRTMILHFKIKQTDNKPYRYIKSKSILRYDAGVGRDKSRLITTPSLFKSFITNNLIN